MDSVRQYNIGRKDATGVTGTLAESLLATCNDVLPDGIRWQADAYWNGIHDQLTNETRATQPVCLA